MFNMKYRPIVVSVMILLSAGIAVISQNNFIDGEVNIDGVKYEVVETEKIDPQFGVVERDGIFRYVSEPEKFKIKIRDMDGTKWLEVDRAAYDIAVTKLKSISVK